jgi:hypothetical protein
LGFHDGQKAQTAHFEIPKAVAAIIGPPASWWLLATICFLPAWLLGSFVNRD